MRYLFDSDVLIASARFHYHPGYCQAFWDWLTAGHRAGVFYSIDKVKGELLDGEKDPLLKWANSPDLAGFFQASLPSLPYWRKLSVEANSPARNYKMGARTKFLNADKADAWLIAHAAHSQDFTIITNEVSAPLSRKEIKLPDASGWLKVPTAPIHLVLKKYAFENFTFSDLV
jgi:hypothetical protein